ncbi:MAG: hypothetical protein KF749_02875 [Bacteroidetes bacterium]|nr:hypothetical protein [Bacteroidota bacterium]MCW5896760.1 hypothetical protein [Bacteroidota bacterium]
MFKPYQPIKRISGKTVLGFFYRDNGDTIQYVTFHSTVVSIAKNKVCPATEQEYREDRKRRYAKIAQRNAAAEAACTNTKPKPQS